MADAPSLHIGTRPVAVSRYKGYKVSGSRERMVIFLHSPDENIKIEGGENVTAALLEIDSMLTPDDKGWEELE